MGRSPLAACALGLLLVLVARPVEAQTGDGNLRGYVKDESGAVLPGVSVTATSPELLAPVTTVTDGAGLYRLNNLPPGTYVITAELPGFSIVRREGILVRAGATFTIDFDLKLSTVQETITVTGESPMIETSKPTTSITLDRELIRAAPISSRRVFSDALDLAPGVSSRNVDDGVGRRSYYFKGAVDLLARLHPRRRAGRVVPRLVGPLDRLRRRHRAGHRAEAERRRRGVADRHRRGDEHPGAARRQRVQAARRSTTTRTSSGTATTPRAAAPRAACPRRSR